MRHGDALVGLTRGQIEAFHWADGKGQLQTGFEMLRTREHLRKVAALRQRIREAGEDVPDYELRLWWSDACTALDSVRVHGDLALAAFFEGAKPKQREDLRKQFANDVQHDRVDQYQSWLEELANADPPLAPFHWQIEFPEVFERTIPALMQWWATRPSPAKTPWRRPTFPIIPTG